MWAALLVALLVRLAYGFEHTSSPDYAWPSVDAHYHDVWARSAAGLPYATWSGFVDPELASTPSLRPPGYPWFLALIYKLSGGSYLAARIVQHLLGLLSVALVWLALRGRVPDGLAALAAGLFAMHFAPVYFEGELQATSLLIALDLLGLHLFLGAVEHGGWKRVLAAGGMLGLAVLVRPNVLLPASMLGVYLVWGGVAGLRRKHVAGLFTLGLAIGILPGTARNWARSGELIPLTATGGINLYLGQGPGANGLIQSDMGELGRFQTCFDYAAVKQHVEQREGHAMSFGELDGWFRRQAWNSIVADPGRAVELLGVKAALLLGPEEVGHNKEVGMERQGSWALRFLPMPFVGLLTLLLWGLLAGLWNRSPSARIAGLARGAHTLFMVHGIWVLGFVVSLLPFFAASRYRTPLIPHFLILSGLGLAAWVGRPGARRVLATTGLLALALALWITSLDTLYRGPFAYKYHLDRGMAHADQERLPEARAEFEAALSADPNNPATLSELAKMDLRLGELERARAGFEKVLAQDLTLPSALYNLGWIAEHQGRWSEALHGYAAAWKSQPTFGMAEQALRRLVLQLATHPEARMRDGRAAVVAMETWNSTRPLTPPDLALWAAALAECGSFTDALATVDRALSMAGENPANSPVVRGLQSARKRYAMGQPLRLAPRPTRANHEQKNE